MSGTLVGILIVLHGLVHLWYFTLSRGLIEFQPEMGWTGRSWLFSNFLGNATTRALASVLYLLATAGFVAGGIGIIGQQVWWQTVVVGSAMFSTAIILLFWDGNTQMMVQKGLLGLLINIAILVALLRLQ
jgi:hypothetical protein